MEPGLQREIYSPPPPLTHHKNKKVPQSHEKERKKERKNRERTTALQSTLLFVELSFVLKGIAKLQGFATINYCSRFTVELVVKQTGPNSQIW